MKELTKQQFDLLNSDQWIVTNLRYTLSGFKRQTSTKENDIVFNVYDELTNSKNYRNYGCPQCLYRAWSAVAKAYYAYTPTPTVEQSPDVEEIATEETTVTEPKKPAKKTVKKKTTKKTAAKKRKTQ